MFIEALYEEGNIPCIVNTDYFVDIFKDKKTGKWKAYVLDDGRWGYIISDSDVEKLLEEQNE